MNLTDEQLLPCPFCGSAAAWFKNGASHGIECGNETDCPGNAQTETWDKEHKYFALTAWNTRAGQAAASVPRECCCKVFRKQLTTNSGTWHICEQCSNGYFLPYAAPAVAQDAAQDQPDDDLLRRLDQTVISGTGWGMPRIDGISLDVVAGRAAARIRELQAENAMWKDTADFMYASAKQVEDDLRALKERAEADGKAAFDLSVECRARAVKAEAERDALREQIGKQNAALRLAGVGIVGPSDEQAAKKIAEQLVVAKAERDALRIDRDSHQRVCLKVMVERDTAVKALRRCHAVMYGDGVMDQEQAWDECLRVLDEWTWTAARIALDEAKP